jgi:hypothetical protein
MKNALMAAVVLVVVVACPPATVLGQETAGETWVSLSGSGLFSLPDTATLAPKHLNLDLAVDNQDRDPMRLDVVDLSTAWTLGLGRRAETYGHVVLSRAVSISPRQSFFPPPVDVVVPEGSAVPSRPYYPLYAPFPYVGRSGSSQIGRFVPGDAVFGGKFRLLAPAGARPGLALNGEIKLPMTKSLSSLQSGSGTGGTDETLRVTAEWRTRRDALVTSVGFTHVGQPPLGDRLIVFRPGGEGRTTDLPLDLANRVGLGLGVRHVLDPRAALVAEVTKTLAVGARTPAFEAAGPLDLTAGAQLRWGRFHLTMAFRYHANSVPALGTEPSPFGGLADMTAVSEPALRSYLEAIGAASALPQLRTRSEIAVAYPVDGPPLPAGAAILPPMYTVRSHGRTAYLFVWGWSFGTARKR